MKKLVLLFAVLVMSIMFAVSASAVLTTSIELPATITIYEGEVVSLEPTFIPENATDKSFTIVGADYTYTYKELVLGGLLGTTTKTDVCKFSDFVYISEDSLIKGIKTTIEPKTGNEFVFNILVIANDGSHIAARTTIKILHKEHKEISFDYKSATCMENGNEAGTKCEICGIIISGGKVIPANGHKWELRSVIPPTCTSNGEENRVCSVCNVTNVQSVPALGGHLIFVLPGKEATCTEGGKTECAYCERCGNLIEEQENIPPLGHNLFWLVTKDATCTEEGEKTEKCVNCDYKSGITCSIPKLAHESGEIDYINATCTQNGLLISGCSICGKVDAELIISAFGHNYQSDWQILYKPKCDEVGLAIKICKDCLDIQTYDIPALGHTDVDFDGKCDACKLSVASQNSSAPCSCNCHKSGISYLIFKIILFFQKLFRTNSECACGAAHY